MSLLKYLVPLLFLLTFISCEKDNLEVDQIEYSEALVDQRDLKKKKCFSAERIGRDQEGCCLFEVCYKGKLFGSTFSLGLAEETLIFTDEQPCHQVTVCDEEEFTLYETNEWESFIHCTKKLTCISVEECCDSICFDYEIHNDGPICFNFSVTLDGNEECFPNGLPLNTSGPFSGPIQLLDYSGSNGTVTLLDSEQNEYLFRYCRDALYLEYDFQFTIRNEYCGSEDTYSFDLFGTGPFYKQCED